MVYQQLQHEKQAITEMALKIYVSRFLRTNINSAEMIRVFELIERNHNGKSRLNNLIKEHFTVDLTKKQKREAIEFLSDYPGIKEAILDKGIILQYLSAFQLKQLGNRSLTEKVIALKAAQFLNPSLTAGEMICVFDLIEQNHTGETRLSRLIEEGCTNELNKSQIWQAAEILNDFSHGNK